MILPNPFLGNSTIKISKPKNNITQAGNKGSLLVMILDESGSMSSCIQQTISGYDEYIRSQKEAFKKDKTYVTLCKFEGYNITYPYSNLPISEVESLSKVYSPRGGTNLLDAIGDAINQTNDYLKNINEIDRPDVIVNIFTDGEENSSRTYSSDDIKELVKKCEDCNWTFTFFGANIDAFNVGEKFGMNTNNTFDYNTKSFHDTMAVASTYTTAMRSAKYSGTTGPAVYATASASLSKEDVEKIK